MIIHLHILGVIFIALAFLHIGFPRYFKWKDELAMLSLINRQMMYVHASFIAVIVLMIGILCITSADELVRTSLGRRISLMLGLFWGLRLITQFFVYSPQLWMGKRFETTVHMVFSILWAYAAAVFLAVSCSQ